MTPLRQPRPALDTGMFSANQIKDCHYIPANHVFTSYMIGGTKGARLDYAKEALEMSNRMLASGFDPVYVAVFIDWYKNSCEALVRTLESGEKISANYPPFVPPAIVQRQSG